MDNVFTLAATDAPVVGGAGTVVAAPVVDGPDVAGPEVLGLDVDGAELVGPDPVVAGPEVDGPEVVAPDDDGDDEAGPLVAGALADGPLVVGATVVLADDDDVVTALNADAMLLLNATVARPPTAATTAKVLVLRVIVSVLLGLFGHGTRPLEQRRPEAHIDLNVT